VQCYSAVNAKVDCLIARNKTDYVTDILAIMSPEEFLAAIAAEVGSMESISRNFSVHCPTEVFPMKIA
jgi:hypothetical protein